MESTATIDWEGIPCWIEWDFGRVPRAACAKYMLGDRVKAMEEVAKLSKKGDVLVVLHRNRESCCSGPILKL